MPGPFSIAEIVASTVHVPKLGGGSWITKYTLCDPKHSFIEIVEEIFPVLSVALPHIRKHAVTAKKLCGAAANEASTYFDGA